MSDIAIIIFGSTEDRSAQGLAGAARQLGGDARAIVVDDYQPEPALSALTDACRGASVVLLGNDTYGQEVAPRLAHRLGGACVGDATHIDVVDGKVRVTRQVYGGKANAVIELRRSPAVISLRARSFAPAPFVIPSVVEGPGREGGAMSVPPTPPGPSTQPALSAVEGLGMTKIVERNAAGQSEARLEDAPVIVSGGRGIGGPEGFHDELQPLAQLLGAQMAASRAACDAGWAPPTWQVGQTGKKVAPELYLAIAITGASQHMAGVSDAKTIAVINTDPDAPIFRHARFGIVEDYRKVVPLLRRKLAELQK